MEQSPDSARSRALAFDLAAEAARLAQRLKSPHLAAVLTERAVQLPVRASEPPGRSESPPWRRVLAEIEAALLIAERLGELSPAEVQPALKLAALLRAHLAGDQKPPTTPEPDRTASPVPEKAPGRPRPAPPGPAAAPAPPPPAAPKAQTPGPADRLLIDGCNFLGRAPGFTLGDDASRDRLLFRLQEYGREHPAHRLVVFFDGQRATRRLTAGIEEHVTSGVRPADDVIIDYLRALPAADRKRASLVTDDRELASRARKEGVRVQSVEWLASRLQRKERAEPSTGRGPGLSRAEVEDWENFFQRPPKRPGA